MKKLIKINLMVALLCFCSVNLMAQSTYYTGFDTDAEKANWTQVKKGKLGNAEWEIIGNGVSEPNRLSHSAPTGDADKDSLVNWYVSPKFDFSEGGSIDSIKYNYFSFMNTFIKEQVVQIYVLVGDNDPAKASSKILLADLTAFYSGDDKNWRDTGDFTIPNTAGDCYIAFKFVAIDGWSSISFDNIYLTENKLIGIEEITKNNKSLFVYPNPSTGEVKVKDLEGWILEDGATVSIYSLQGAKLKELELNYGININLDLPKGTYLYKIKNKNEEVLAMHKLQIIE